MKEFIISLFTIFLLFLAACNQPKETQINLEILKHVYYDNMSSASGVTIIKGDIYIVGDDIPWMVEINDDLTVGALLKLSGIDSIIDGRTPYKLKADYECMETFDLDGNLKTLVVSSGSKINSRDTAVLIIHGDQTSIIKRNLRPLFEHIKTQADMGDEEINVEGVAVSEQMVYLFHRGNISGNFIAEFHREDFLNYLETGHYHQLGIKIYPFDLPDLNGIQSGFSGAYFHADKQILLFTASMENTGSVTADGEVSGSYIGFIPLKNINTGNFYSKLLEKDGNIYAKKLEGITVKSYDGNTLDILTVCDNDDGSSDLFLIKMNIIKE